MPKTKTKKSSKRSKRPTNDDIVVLQQNLQKSRPSKTFDIFLGVIIVVGIVVIALWIAGVFNKISPAPQTQKPGVTQKPATGILNGVSEAFKSNDPANEPVALYIFAAIFLILTTYFSFSFKFKSNRELFVLLFLITLGLCIPIIVHKSTPVGAKWTISISLIFLTAKLVSRYWVQRKFVSDLEKQKQEWEEKGFPPETFVELLSKQDRDAYEDKGFLAPLVQKGTFKLKKGGENLKETFKKGYENAQREFNKRELEIEEKQNREFEDAFYPVENSGIYERE